MLERIINIWRKELMDNIRDRKALMQAILIPLTLGIFYAVFNPMITASFSARAKEELQLPAQGIEYADPDFVALLKQNKITLVPYEGDLRQAVSNGELPAGLIFPANFAGNISGERPAQLELLTNLTTGGIFGGNFSNTRMELAVSTYNSIESARRVQSRSVDPSLLVPVLMSQSELSSSDQRAGLFASFSLPLLVVLLLAQGGLFIAIDVTAGEKERGTLEALMITPATDTEVLVGKLIATFTLSLLSIILTLIGFYIATILLPYSVTQGAVLPFRVILVAIIVALPLTLFVNVIQLIICVRAKAFKDAQSSAGLLSFAFMVPAFASAFMVPSNSFGYLIPIYGPAAAIGTVAIGGPLPPLAIPFALLGSVIATVIGLVIARQRFDRERMLYSA